MLRYVGIVMSIGLADSLNPSTVAPALYLAAGQRPRRAVAQFTLAVFIVSFVGGALIAVGPGQIVLSLVPKPSHTTRQVLEVLAGVVLITVGVLLWVFRQRLRDRQLPMVQGEGRTSWVLGASIMALELPTAFPYLGTLAAIIGSGLGLVRQVLLVVLYNVCFVLPLLGILATLSFAGERADAELARARDFLQRHWPILFAAVALVAGAITIALGLTGTIRAARGLLHRGLHALR